MIQLGLSRISRLLEGQPMPWQAIHVAGTNGKGSVCAYISAMLSACGVSWGRYNSPHLLDRWDSIFIRGRPVGMATFQRVEQTVHARNQASAINATEFELLTATAFQLFVEQHVKVGVVEVGVGGRLDATNVLHKPLATVITEVSNDHESLLGNTLEEIAFQKAGILKPGVPCFVDAGNVETTSEVIRKEAEQVGSGPLTFVDGCESDFSLIFMDTFNDARQPSMLGKLQRRQIALAFRASKAALQQLEIPHDNIAMIRAAQTIAWPGRLQMINLSRLTQRRQPVLLDGAHNLQSARLLGSYVQERLRVTSGSESSSVTWVLAASQGKDMRAIMTEILQPGDSVITVGFSSVDGMPWVYAVPGNVLLESAQSILRLARSSCSATNVKAALDIGCRISSGGPLVVAGSLYLVSDVLRLLRGVGVDPWTM